MVVKSHEVTLYYEKTLLGLKAQQILWEINMNGTEKTLAVLLADTYALYLKTQNYHWHVRGSQFKSLHTLFETQYIELADAIDTIAERIVTLGHIAPATFKSLETLKTIKDGDASTSAQEMVKELAADNQTLVKDLNKAIRFVQEQHDEGTASLLADRLLAHEKARWMLEASQD